MTMKEEITRMLAESPDLDKVLSELADIVECVDMLRRERDALKKERDDLAMALDLAKLDW